MSDTLHGLFANAVARFPQRVAVEDDTRTVTYRDLSAQANRLAHRLRARGVAPETTVALCLERSVDLVAGILGILSAGGAYVPLDASYPADRLRYMVTDSGARILVTRRSMAPAMAAALAQTGAELLLIDENGDNESASTTQVADASRPEHLAYVIYTSGSSGTPKGVLVEHRNVISSLRGLQQAFPAGPDAAYLFKSNHTFDASLLEIFGAMWQGGRTVLLRPGGEHDPLAVLDAIAARRVTHLFYVTSMIESLLATCPAAKIDALRSLEHLLVGGEAMPVRLASRLRALAGPVRIANVYGPTETAIICTAFPLEPGAASLTTPIGSMLGSLSARVLDQKRGDVRDGDVGELHIGGDSVARGYLNAPDLTADRFIIDADGRRLYRTGDLCRITNGGVIEYVDRIDRQIKIRGYRVDLGEIESHLMSHPDIRAAAVVATGPSGDLRLSAYYSASDQSVSVPPAALRRHLQRFLPDHMLPLAWLQMPALPLNENGKVDRKALPAIAAPAPLRAAQHDGTPRAVIETIWCDELGIPEIPADADFFALGGHSLAAARVVNVINTQLGRHITVSDLYAAPTLDAFEARVSASPTMNTTHERAVAVPPAHERRLSYDQVGFWVLDKLKVPYLNVIARRRVAGRIDAAALAEALQRVVTMHPALRSRMHTWTPAQTTLGLCPVDLVERDFSAMSGSAREAAALVSMDELASRTAWSDGTALVEVRLVTLGPASSEVQIAMPHIISDEASGAILFDDLSEQYLGIMNRAPVPAVPNDGFAAFVREERESLRGTLQASTAFWNDYLADATPICFPESAVLDASTQPESIYIDLPESFVDALHRTAQHHRLSIADLLSAAAMRAAADLAEGMMPGTARPVLHLPRSTRDRAAYDDAIGLFARIDLLKIALDDTDDLPSLARRVRRAALETSAHQRTPTMIKSAALNAARWAPRDRWSRAAARAAALLMPRADIDIEVLRAQTRLAAMRMTTERDFAIGVNVLNSFVSPAASSLFGLPIAHAPVHPTYAPPFRRVLELYFLRDAGRPQLMLNGDLQPDFRRALGLAVVQAIQGRHAAA